MSIAVGGIRKFIPMVLSYAASSASLVVANAAQLITFAILARSFGTEEFGHYVVFTALTSIAVQLCGLGSSECLVRRVAQDRAAYALLFGHNLVLILSTGLVCVVAGMAAVPFIVQIAANEWTDLWATFLLLCTNIVFVRLIMLAEGIYLAQSRFAAANRSVVTFALVRTATAALACIGFGVTTVATWAVWQFVSHAIIVLVFGWQIAAMGKPHLRILREEIRLGILFATPFIFRAIRQNADLMVLGVVANIEVAASYAVARKITDSSYIAIDALNRIVYPSLAAASMKGIHHAMAQTRRLVLVALGLGCMAALVIFIAAPYLPLLFGHQYTSLPGFCQIMSGCIIFIAVWSIAVDLLGAASFHGPRAWVLNLGNGLGAGFIGVATWIWPPDGTFLANYLIEIGIMIAAWTILLKLVSRSRAAAVALP